MKRILLNFLMLSPGLIFAQCEDPTAVANLDINNVNATIHNGQSMWTFESNAGYEVPKGEGVSAMYAGQFWMGGVSPDQQLKLAGGTYGVDGSDYYPGPLSVDGLAQTTPDACLSYDRIWTIYRADVELHLAYFDCLNDGNCDLDELFPYGYVVPDEFIDYPAHGDIALQQDFNLAPWYDYDQDGIYNPELGDCPLFDFMSDEQECGLCYALKGDMCLYWIDNDKGSVHLATGGEPIGIEIHNMAYSFASNGTIDNTTIYCKRVINRGTQTLQNTHMGLWLDGDLGTPTDDYVGSDIGRDLAYFYNGDANDEPSFSSDGYGENPPACGVRLLGGPLMDFDNYDNDGDGIVDNERFGMTSLMSYSNSNGPNGEPNQAMDFYAYLRSFWLDGAQLLCGGDGEPTNWMYGADTYPDDCGPWTEELDGNPPGDRRSVMAAGPFTLEPGMEKHMEYAVVWAKPDPLIDITPGENLALASDSVYWDYLNCFGCLPPGAVIGYEQVGPNTYTFINYGQGDIVEWDFGDGTTATGTMVTHTFLSEGEFNVTMTSDNDCGEEAVDSVLVESVVVGIDDPVELSLTVTPNPSMDHVTLLHPEALQLDLRLFDSLGRLVMSDVVSTNVEIGLGHLAKGHYIIQARSLDNQKNWTEKLVLR